MQKVKGDTMLKTTTLAMLLLLLSATVFAAPPTNRLAHDMTEHDWVYTSGFQPKESRVANVDTKTMQVPQPQQPDIVYLIPIHAKQMYDTPTFYQANPQAPVFSYQNGPQGPVFHQAAPPSNQLVSTIQNYWTQALQAISNLVPAQDQPGVIANLYNQLMGQINNGYVYVQQGWQNRPTIQQTWQNLPSLQDVIQNRPTLQQAFQNINIPTVQETWQNIPSIQQTLQNIPSVQDIWQSRPGIIFGGATRQQAIAAEREHQSQQ